jgi:hypothetical protein
MRAFAWHETRRLLPITLANGCQAIVLSNVSLFTAKALTRPVSKAAITISLFIGK